MLPRFPGTTVAREPRRRAKRLTARVQGRIRGARVKRPRFYDCHRPRANHQPKVNHVSSHSRRLPPACDVATDHEFNCDKTCVPRSVDQSLSVEQNAIVTQNVRASFHSPDHGRSTIRTPWRTFCATLIGATSSVPKCPCSIAHLTGNV